MEFNTRKIAFIGSGNMARSFVKGLVKSGFAPQNLLVTGRNKLQLEYFSDELKVKTSTNNLSALDFADIIVLCLKPFQLKAECCALAAKISSQKEMLFISVAAGIRIETYAKWLGEKCKIVRAMPNTPAAVGCGVTGLFANNNVDEVQKAFATELMATVGQVFWLSSDKKFDAVTALAGSGPAYVFLFMSALQTAAINSGLDVEEAEAMTKQMMLGAAELALHHPGDVTQLKQQVTSPGGTTEQALKIFEQGGLTQLVEAAFLAAVKRGKEIAEDLDEA